MTSLNADVLRAWSSAIDTATLRAIRRARARLERCTRGELLVPAALCLARLAQSDDVPIAEDALQRALPRARGNDVAQIELALAAFTSALPDAVAHAERARACGDPATALLAELRLARLEQRRGNLPAATAHLAQVQSRAPKGSFLEANVLTMVAIQSLSEGKKSTARAGLERAFRILAGSGADFEASEVAGVVGNVLHDLGDLPSAIRWYGAAMRHAALAGSRVTVAIFALYEGWALHESGRRPAARASYTRAKRGLRGPALRRFWIHADTLATLLSGDREPLKARVAIARAHAELEALGERARASAIATLGVLIEVEEAARAKNPKTAVLGMLRAARSIANAPATSDDERVALRMARAALERAMARVARRKTALAVASDGVRVKVGARTLSFAKHPTLARIVTALAEATLEGRRLELAELVAIGWPGEKLSESSATHRVHVALSTLRSRGLGGVLPREPRDRGYAFAAETIGLLG